MAGIESLRGILAIEFSATLLLNTYRQVSDDPLQLVSDAIHDFLEGVGIPCLNMFRTAKAAFDPLVMDSNFNFDDPCTRSKILVWAVTGAPLLPPDSEPLTVSRQNVHLDVKMEFIFYLLISQLRFVDDQAFSHAVRNNEQGI